MSRIVPEFSTQHSLRGDCHDSGFIPAGFAVEVVMKWRYAIGLVSISTALTGCTTPRVGTPAPSLTIPTLPEVREQQSLTPVQHTEPIDPAPSNTSAIGLSELTVLTIQRHPRLAQVGWAVEAARGRALQAGLYPNPKVDLIGDELGDRTGPAGTLSLPQVSQEIVRGNKLELAKAVALREVDQATLTVVAERYRLLADVRQSYWDVVSLRQRAEVLTELIQLADRSIENAEKLLKAKEGSELDVVQLEVDRERYRAELDATQQSLPAAFRRLAASTGVPDLPEGTVTGRLDQSMPELELQPLQAYILGVHPLVESARVGVERARAAIRRAEAEPTPNITLTTGYVRQSQNRSNDWMLGASLPVPLWNKNQGNILAARAELGEALNEVGRVQSELSAKITTAFGSYAAAKARVAKYRSTIIPKAERSLQLSQKAYQGGQFEYLRVLQAQRAVAEARLELVRSLGEQWRSASELSSLSLDDQWPNSAQSNTPTNTQRTQP
jgi:outer membrane protein, heavy metal efflux system